MSGICGIIQLNKAPVDRAELRRMAEVAACRGGGGITYRCDGPVGFAHLRPEHHGHAPEAVERIQPLFRPGPRKALFAADARLDNPAELEVPPADPAVRSGAMAGAAGGAASEDAERIMAQLLDHPESGPERLVGDFACALWDGARDELRLSRDAMGVRSLYYRVEPERVLFATEVKQILAAEGVPRRLNEHTVAWYLCGMQTPPGQVFYAGVEAVRPAEEVVIDARGRVRRRVFWQPDPAHRIRYRREEEYSEHLRTLLIEALRCRLRGHAVAGVSLSGGMDSATVASVAGWLRERGESGTQLRAYSWDFATLKECDESENTRRVADRYGIPVTWIPVERHWPLVEYPNHGPHEDDPFTSMYHACLEEGLAQARADAVSLMLYGNRGDAICGGEIADVPGMLQWGRFADARAELRRLRWYYELSKPATVLRHLLRPVVTRGWVRRAALQLQRATAASSERGGPWGRAEPHIRRSFLSRAGLPPRDPLAIIADRRPGYAGRERFEHVFSPLVAHGVQYAERLVAQFGAEFADPWSDRRIAEFILAVPQHLVNRATEAKRLPRRAMRGIMTSDALMAARKVSPEPLYLNALRSQAHDTVVGLLTDSRCEALGFVDGTLVRERFAQFVRGEREIFDLWSTVSLEIWLRRHWP